MLPLTGSAAVTNGSDLVTWTGAALSALNCVPGATVALGGVVYFVKQVTDTNKFLLTRSYAAANGTVPAEIQQLSPNQVATATLNARAAELIAQLSLVEEIGRGLFYRFSATTADADPGPGYLRLNHADPALATSAFIDLLDAGKADVSGELDSWDDSSSLIKGRLWLRSQSDRSSFRAYSVTAVATVAGYRKPVLVHLGGSGSFAQDEELTAFFVPTGDAGDAYATDAEVADVAGLAAHAGAADGFKVFVGDLGAGQDNRAGVVRKSGGTWPVVALYTGPKGAASTVPGPTGPAGVVPRGAWSGATTYALNDLSEQNGSTWISLQASNLNHAPPTLPTTANAWWRIFARKGNDGAGTVASVVGSGPITVDASDPTAPVVSAPKVLRVDAPNGFTSPEKAQGRLNIGALGRADSLWTPIEGLVDLAGANGKVWADLDAYCILRLTLFGAPTASGKGPEILLSRDNGSMFDNSAGNYQYHYLSHQAGLSLSSDFGSSDRMFIRLGDWSPSYGGMATATFGQFNKPKLTWMMTEQASLGSAAGSPFAWAKYEQYHNFAAPTNAVKLSLHNAGVWASGSAALLEGIVG